MWADDVEIHLVYSDECTAGSQKGELVAQVYLACLLGHNTDLLNLYSFPIVMNDHRSKHGDAT